MSMNHDVLNRIICETLNLRAYTATTLATVREITALHGTSPNATVALGRTITAAALLSATLKPDSDQGLLLKVEGTGPVKEIHAQADARGNLRGYVANPQPDVTDNLDSLSFSKTIGAGFLTVRKDIGMKEPYTSVIPLHTGELASDVAYYLTVSEQVPSAVIIGLTLDREGAITSSGGILIQTFPGTSEDIIGKIEENIASLKPSLGESLRDGTEILDVLKGLFNHEAMAVLDSRRIRASCRCDRSMIASMLASLHRDDLQQMIDKDGGAEITCTFCNKKYHFSGDELSRIVLSKDHNRNSPAQGTPGREVH